MFPHIVNLKKKSFFHLSTIYISEVHVGETRALLNKRLRQFKTISRVKNFSVFENEKQKK